MQPQLNRAFHLVSQPNNQSIKQGQHLLAMLKKDRAYPIALLHYMNNPSIAPDGKLRAAIQLKLWCQFYKNLEEFQRNFYKQVQQSIKQSILHACLNFPRQISKTLIPGIVSLADVLFPNKWENLMMNLMSSGMQNPTSIKTVLELMEEITKKYTYLSRSDPLYEQIIKVCDEIHDFLKDLTTNILQIVINDSNKQNQAIILEILMRLFYNLNYQDLHPKYEDNLQHWMNVLKAVMKLPNANQNIFKCKGAALQAILLYANKYKEDVEQTIRDFCFQIWPLCSSASQDQEYDSIVFNCLKFFKSLMNWPEMKSFFAENIDQLFEMLILPNITLNNTAKALFEEQPEIYIDYYFRNTEIQTRRSAAIELLRIISRFYNAFQPFLKKQIQSFMELPPGNIHAECIILGLVIDGSTKSFRDIDGCTQLFIAPQIIEYCYHSIAKKSLGQVYERSLKNSDTPLEKAFNVMHITTLIRFLFFFRIYLPREELASVLQFLASLKSQNPTLNKIIYMSINGFLMMRHGDYDNYRNLVFFFNSQNLRPIAFDILKLIYEGTKGEQFLHEGLTKMFFNLSKTLREANCQFFLQQKETIKQMLNRTAQYDFQSAQFLFQAIGYLSFYYIKANSKDKNELEGIVLNFFQSALNTKSDLLNFCLQVLAIFLQLESSSNYQYQTIYQALLLPQNWKQQNQSVMSSYIQFINSFIARNRPRLVSDRPAIEVILSKIIQIDHVELFFRFLEAIMMNTNLDEFNDSGYMRIVVQGCQALAHSIQGKKAALLFVSKLLVNYNNHVQALNMINNCCPRFYDQLLEASCDILQTISIKKDRKCIFSAICKAVSTGYFVDSRIQGMIFDSLISNTVDRFNLRNISSYVAQNQRKQKKQATYRKIQVFKQFEKPEVELKIDQQELFVMTFKQAVGQRGQILNYVNEKNKERIIRLSQKYTR